MTWWRLEPSGITGELEGTVADLSPWLDRVTCGDCLEVLKELPDGCVDLCFTDPPYGISDPRCTRVRTVVGGGRHSSGNATFSNVGGDFGAEDVEADDAWIEQVYRVLRPGGSFATFCGQNQWQRLRHVSEAAGFQARNPWFWHKTNPPPTPRQNFASSVEMGWWFTKPGERHYWAGGALQQNCFYGPHLTTTFASGLRIHPMQKPEWLVDEMLRLLLPPGGIVLDCFSGSGAIAVCAVRCGGHFVAIERDEAHCRNSERRIAEALHPAQLSMDAA